MRKHDVGFLIGIDAVRKTASSKYDKSIPFKEQVSFGVKNHNHQITLKDKTKVGMIR